MREPSSMTAVDSPGAPSATIGPSLPPKGVVWLFRLWWVLAALFVAAILAVLLVPPLVNAPSSYAGGVQSRFSALLDLASAYLLPALAGAVLLVALTCAGYLANRRVRSLLRQSKTAQTAGGVSGRGALDRDSRSDTLGIGQSQPVAGQPASSAPGVGTLEAPDTVAGGTALAGPAREEIQALAQETGRTTPSGGSPGLTRRVFLSSTVVDLAKHRARVHDDLERLNQFAVDMAQFGAGGADATTVSYTELASAEFVVLIVAWRYGFIPAGETRSITHLEYEEAKRLGLPIFVYLADPSTEADDGPNALFPAATRTPEHAAQLAAFRQELQDSNTQTYDTFTTPEDLSAKVATALARRLLREAQAGRRQGPDASGRVLDLVDMPQHGPFIGRESELADLLARLQRGDDVGVFAVEGMGGVGKTALAAEAVERFASDERAFPGGVVWVACAGLEGDSGLLSLLTQVARALGRAEIASLTALDPLRRSLAAAMRERPRTLLALDNIEREMDAATMLQTLSARGHTTLLLTAREPVAEGQVAVIPLNPLPSPEAALLFTQRLAQETNGARPTADEQGQIPALVEAVGGLPLAVELLAADAAHQGTTLANLLQELQRSGINAGAFRADPKRTLGEIFDRSYLRLSQVQQRLFAGLGLLAEVGFPREAAEAVAVAAGETVDPAEVVRILVRAGLVEPLSGGERLRLHPLLQAYAREKLAELGQEVSDALGDAMLAYWLAYAEAHPNQNGNDPLGMDAQEAEAAGFMAAFEWAHERERHRALLDLVYALDFTWDVRGRRAEERRFLVWSIDAARALEDTRELLFMMHGLAVLDDKTGNVAAAREGYAEALRLARELGDNSAIRSELHGLAALDADAGNVAAARAGYEEALRLARELGNKAAIQIELHELAVLDADAGRTGAAAKGFEEALALARELGDPEAEATELRNLGDTIRYLGETTRARQLIEESLAIAERLGSPFDIGTSLEFLGRLDEQEGKVADAIAHYREALRRFEQVQSPRAEVVRERLSELGA